ncbi:MAG: hypothetical protein ACXAB7_16140 [Candidatus Kariarchaeaceae archaeon]|jgi:hypothetical protein
MAFFRKYRRGQIRGIDFSLAMVIFLLTMSQILILTNNFIESNSTHQNLQERQSETNRILEDIVSSPGGYIGDSDWSSISTNSLNTSSWDFGLLSNQSLDPFKFGRLASSSLDEYILTYDALNEVLETGNKKFRIEVVNPLNISISSVIDNNPNLLISGEVTLNDRPIDSTINIFVIAADSSVARGITHSDSLGNYNIAIDLNLDLDNFASTAYTVVAMAKYGQSVQDVAYHTFLNTAPSVGSTKLSVFRGDTSLGYGVNVTGETNDATAQITVLYQGVTNQENYTTQPLIQTTGFWRGDGIPLPERGMVVLILHERDLTDLNFNAVVSFPILLDNEISNMIEPSTASGSQVASISTSILIRGVLLYLRVSTWR